MAERSRSELNNAAPVACNQPKPAPLRGTERKYSLVSRIRSASGGPIRAGGKYAGWTLVNHPTVRLMSKSDKAASRP